MAAVGMVFVCCGYNTLPPADHAPVTVLLLLPLQHHPAFAAVLSGRFKAVYVRRRHSVVFLQRLLRLTYPLLTLLRGSDVGQAALAQALNSSMQHVAVGGGNDNTTPVAMAAAVAGLARPLMVTPVQTLSQVGRGLGKVCL